LFKVDGSSILNGLPGKVTAVSILNNQDVESKHITVNEKPDGRISQQWEVVYADEWKGEPGKGELNEDFGLYIQRPFYIVSALNDHRYLDLIVTNTWSSRQEMVERLRPGGSTKPHTLSRPSTTTTHGTSNQLVNPLICKSIAPTHNGSRSSSIKETNS